MALTIIVLQLGFDIARMEQKLDDRLVPVRCSPGQRGPTIIVPRVGVYLAHIEQRLDDRLVPVLCSLVKLYRDRRFR